MDTYSYRNKFISSILLEDGTSVTEHAHKVDALQSAYRSRLGITEFSGILYDLSSLLTVDGLMDDAFSMEEIMEDMPSDHTPGPDGFNGAFFKR